MDFKIYINYIYYQILNREENMKIIILTLMMLFYNSCESDGPTGISLTPESITTVSMGLSNVESNFENNSDAQNSFIDNLAQELNLNDANRIQILSITVNRASAIIELMFLDSSDDDLSVEDLLESILEVNSVGDYGVENIELSIANASDSVNYLLNAADSELKNILNSLYECEDNDYYYYEDNTNCTEELNFMYANNLYLQVLDYEPSNAGANFGAGITEMLSATNDSQLKEFMNEWDGWDEGSFFPENNRSNQTIFNSKFIPIGLDGFIFPTKMNFSSYLPFNYLFDYIERKGSDESDNRNGTYMSDMMSLVDNMLLPKISSSINHLENAINKDFKFEISPLMQGDEYQYPLQMDDAEMHLLMAGMHAIKYALYSISAIDLDTGTNPGGDIEDFTILEQNSNFLKLREGKENYFPLAHDEIFNMLNSLNAAYEFIQNDIDTSNDITLWQEINQATVETNDGLVSVEDFIKPQSGGTIYDIFNSPQTVQLCNKDCDYGCDGENFYNDWMGQCYCYNSGSYYDQLETCTDVVIDLEGFMNNPPNNLKDILPSYEISTYNTYQFDYTYESNSTNATINFDECNNIQSYDSGYFYFNTNYEQGGSENMWNPSSGNSSNILECEPINSYMSELYNNINVAFSDTTGYAEAYENCSDSMYYMCYDINNLGVSYGSSSVNIQGNSNINFSYNISGTHIDNEINVCINWAAQNEVEWKGQWDITLGGLLPQMNNGDFFTSFINVDWEEVNQECSD